MLQALTFEEAQARRDRLAKMRALLFYHELKAKRVKAIKSKEYHRRLNRAAKRKAAKAGDAGDDDEALRAAAEDAEFERVKVPSPGPRCVCSAISCCVAAMYVGCPNVDAVGHCIGPSPAASHARSHCMFGTRPRKSDGGADRSVAAGANQAVAEHRSMHVFCGDLPTAARLPAQERLTMKHKKHEQVGAAGAQARRQRHGRGNARRHRGAAAPRPGAAPEGA